MIALPELDADENGNHEAEANEEANDAGVAPCVVGAAPLEGEQEADNGGDEDGGTVEVKLTKTGGEGHILGFGRVAVDVDKEEDDDHGETTDGQIDVKAPAPGGMLGEGTAEERTSNTGNTPHATNEAESKRSLLKRH